MKVSKLLEYLIEEAKKFPQPVRAVRVWWEGPERELQGVDIVLETKVVVPIGTVADDMIDWHINLTDNDDFEGEDEPCTLAIADEPMATP